MSQEALTVAEAYLVALTAFAYSAERPVELRELGASPEARRMFGAMRGHEREVYRHLAKRLPDLPDPFAAGVLAILLGEMVERGEDPAPLGDAMRARLPDDFAAARRFAEVLAHEYGADEPDAVSPEARIAVAAHEPRGAAAWAAQQLTTPAAMAAWSRDPSSRRTAAGVAGLAADARWLGEHGGYAYYIGALLSAADGMELVVLAPDHRTGFVVELTVVRNAAHLFALLEGALVGEPSRGLLPGPQVDPEVAPIARGEAAPSGDQTFQIGWHYEYWFGVDPAVGARITGLHPLVAAMIGVEATIHDLPTVGGRAVILMRPSMLASRSCAIGGFFEPLHEALRSAVEIRRVLSAAEVDAMLEELRREAADIAGGSSRT